MSYIEFPACILAEDGPLWADNLTIATDNPDFTVCMQQTFISWIPSFWLFGTLPFYLLFLDRSPTWCKITEVSRFNLVKTILCGLILIVNLMEFIDALIVSGERTVGSWRFVTPILTMVTMIACAVLTNFEYRKSVNSSFILFTFWLLNLLSVIIKTQSAIRTRAGNTDGHVNMTDFQFGLQFAALALLALQFALTFKPDNWCVPEFWLSQNTRPTGGSKSASYNERTPLLTSASYEMEPEKKASSGNKNYCPVVFSAFMARVSFMWSSSFCWLGYKRPLVYDDCWKLPHELANESVLPVIEDYWNKEVQLTALKNKQLRAVEEDVEIHRADDVMVTAVDRRRPSAVTPKPFKPSMFRAMAKYLGWQFFFIGFIRMVSDLISFVQPVFLNGLIDVIQGTDEYQWHGYVLACGMFAVGVIRSLIFNYFHFSVMQCAMKTRTALTGMIYRKSLRLSVGGNKDSSVGESVNLIAVDVIRIQEAMLMLHLLWSVPMVISVAMAMLWQQLGVATIAGISVMILLLPLNAYLGARIKKMQFRQMQLKDSRIRLLSEVLNGIKVLKMYAWEMSYRDMIARIRDTEYSVLRKAAFLGAFASVSLFVSPFLVATVCFATFVLAVSATGLTANVVFYSLSVINIIYMPINAVPQVIQQLVQVMVSFKRINEYMNRDEIDDNAVTHVEKGQRPGHVVSIENADFAWSENERPSLSDVTLKIKRGALMAIVGPVGSGKTSLLHAILGEMKRVSGNASVQGSVAYIPQQSWVLSSTIRDNIVFGKNFDSRLYEKVVSACALRPDFDILPQGDKTEVGDKGVNLSGGQRKRITLARAVYMNQDIYILDDPLSAVDCHVGEHIFEHVIGPTGLLSRKTRILVTHNLKVLPKVDYIVMMDRGEIIEVGGYNELLQRGGFFAQWLKSFLDELEEARSSDDQANDPDFAQIKDTLRRQLATLESSFKEVGFSLSNSLKSESIRTTSKVSRASSRRTKKKSSDEQEDGLHLISDEKVATGNVKGAVYWTYVKATGLRFFTTVVCSYCLYVAVSVGSNYWLSLWSADRYVADTNNVTIMPTEIRLGVYVGIGVLQILSVFVMTIATAQGMCTAGRFMHSVTLNRIVESPSSFFDTTPVGRILNRLSKDIDTLDVSIPNSVRQWMMTEALVICTVIAITIASPALLIIMVPIAVLFVFFQRIYIATARQLKRIDSVLRSPICNHFHATLLGLTSIRAFGSQREFTEISDALVERSQTTYFPQMAAIRWVGVSLEVMSASLILATGVYGIWQRNVLSPSLAALSVTYSLQIVNALNLSVRSKCDIENHIVSVERLDEYANLPKEEPDEKRARCVAAAHDWPQRGAIKFIDYSTRYRPGLDFVLRDLNLTIQPREKIGIVGRTGAGKSSLSLAVLRIIEPASGTILIDDVDVTSLTLHELRGKVNLIPQEPVLFSGSLRLNLDPFGRYRDEELWKALEAAHLAPFVRALPDGLSHLCSDGGENLSVGQRQLVCLARALLRKTRILVLDEATAAIDFETDQLIQSTIRELFTDCTILTIAHRLNTIIDYDRILVLESGRVAEFDTPRALVEDENSRFYAMARDADVLNLILKQ